MDCPYLCLEAFWLQEWERVLEDCHKRSCWKNSIGVGVPRPCGSDVYVCSRSCRLCLTVVYWLLECNKVPSWIENPEYVTIDFKYSHIINNTNRQELGFISLSMTSDGVWYPRTLWFRKVPPSLQVRSPVNSHRLLTQHVGKAAPYMDSSEANEYKSNLLQTDYRFCYEIWDSHYLKCPPSSEL
jgi:hypothetical protein